MEELVKNKNEIKAQNEIELLNQSVSEQPKTTNKKFKTETPKEKEKLVGSTRNEIMEIFDGKKNIIEKSKIKEGVNFVFEQNPELEKIGSKEKYSEYLDTVFPESKVRDIVYHYSSVGEKIEEEGFKSAVDQRSRVAGLDKDALYFTKSPIIYWGDGVVDLYRVCTLLNVKNPLDFSNYSKDDSFETLSEEDKNKYKRYEKLHDQAHYEENNLNDIYEKSKHFTKLLKNEGYDAILQPELSEIEIFDKQNIYILGNNKDLENFKKFIENNPDSQP